MSPLLIEADECGYTWRSGDGILHRCIAIPDHGTGHSCFCGVSTDTPAAPPSFTEAAGPGLPCGPVPTAGLSPRRAPNAASPAQGRGARHQTTHHDEKEESG